MSTAYLTHCSQLGFLSEACIQGKSPRGWNPISLRTHQRQGRCPGKPKETSPDPAGEEEGTPWLRAARILSPSVLSLPSLQAPSLPCKEILIIFPLPEITGNSVPEEVVGRAQPTGYLQRFLVLPSLAGTVPVDGFGQLDDQSHQENQKQYGAQRDDKRHIPRRWRIHVFPPDLVGDPGLEGQRRRRGSGGWWHSWHQHSPMSSVYFTLCSCSIMGHLCVHSSCCFKPSPYL